jgi:large subunit ribosomal protein L24
VQTTLLGLAIAVILALVAALVAPLVVDWNHYRTAFESAADRLTGLHVRVTGTIEARILPSPRIRLTNVEIGEAARAPQLRAGALDMELRLTPLVRGRLEASELHLVAPQLSVGLDRSGAIDWPAPSPSFRPDKVSIARLSVEDGSLTLGDAASGKQVVLQKLSFAGEVRSLLGPFSGEGSFVADGAPYRYQISGSPPEGAAGLKFRLVLDPTNQPLTTQLDGTFTFTKGVPQFDGTVAMTRPVAVTLANGQRLLSDPWQANGTVQATPAAVSLKNMVFQYGPEERPLAFAGQAEVKLGAQPRFSALIKALQLDVDRALAAPDLTRKPPLLLLKSFAEAFTAAATLPMPGEIGFSIDGLTVGGSSLQALRGAVRFDAGGWSIEGLDFRAPGLTEVNLSGRLTNTASLPLLASGGPGFSGTGAIESGDVNALLAWVGGRSAAAGVTTSTLNAQGKVAVAADRLAFDDLTATLDRESVAGRVAYSWPTSDRPAVVDADLHATKLNLDALAAFAKSAVDADGFDLPRQGSLALDIGDVTVAGVEMQAVNAQAKFDAGAVQIDRLSIGALGGAALSASGRIDELSSQPRGQLTVDLDAGVLTSLTPVIGKFAPQAADILSRAAARLAPAKLHAVMTAERTAAGGSAAKLDLTGQLGLIRLTLSGQADGVPSAPAAANVQLDTRLDADDGTALLALFGADRVAAVDRLPASLMLSAGGPLDGDIRLYARAAASGLATALQGSMRLHRDQPPSGTFQVSATAADLRPLQQALTGQPGDAIPVSARAAVTLDHADLALTGMAVGVGHSALRGHLNLHLASPMKVAGAIEGNDVDAAAIAGLLLGLPGQVQNTAGPWSNLPGGAGAFAALDGAISFKFDRAALTPTLAASSLNGTARFQPPQITLDDVEGTVAGGHLIGRLTFRHDADGVVGHGEIELAGADLAPLLAADGKNINGKLTLRLDGDSIGHDTAALVGGLHGSGAIELADAHLGRFDPAAFRAAVQATDPDGSVAPPKLKTAVSAALDGGGLDVPHANAVVTITAGRLRVGNTALAAQNGAGLAFAGSLDLNNGRVDSRMTLSAPPPAGALIGVPPELGVALRGPLAAPERTIDVSALTGWLTLRAAELQTRRLELIAASGRPDVLDRAVRPGFPVVRALPAGAMTEAGISLSAPTTPNGRGLDRLLPEMSAAAGPVDPAKQHPAPTPLGSAPPATSDRSSPLDWLFRLKN